MKSLVEFWLAASDKQKKELLLTLTNQQLKFLMEIIYNIVTDNISIPEKHKKQLIKHKLSIQKVLTDGISTHQRRQRLFVLAKILPIFLNNYLQWLKN